MNRTDRLLHLLNYYTDTSIDNSMYRPIVLSLTLMLIEENDSETSEIFDKLYNSDWK